MPYQLAQINVARMLDRLDSPRLADFVANLDRINALAEASPGFVWRLKGDGENATGLRAFDDELVLVNMSVWTSGEALRAYVYGSAHVEVLRRRHEWFERMKEMHTALWWVPAGEYPYMHEGRRRLEHLRTHGPTRYAFSLQSMFEAEAG